MLIATNSSAMPARAMIPPAVRLRSTSQHRDRRLDRCQQRLEPVGVEPERLGPVEQGSLGEPGQHHPGQRRVLDVAPHQLGAAGDRHEPRRRPRRAPRPPRRPGRAPRARRRRARWPAPPPPSRRPRWPSWSSWTTTTVWCSGPPPSHAGSTTAPTASTREQHGGDEERRPPAPLHDLPAGDDAHHDEPARPRRPRRRHRPTASRKSSSSDGVSKEKRSSSPRWRTAASRPARSTVASHDQAGVPGVELDAPGRRAAPAATRAVRRRPARRRGGGAPTSRAARPGHRPARRRPWSRITTCSHSEPTRSSWWLDKQHDASLAGQLAQQPGQVVDADRVEPGERLVEDQQGGVVDQRDRQLGPLLVAVRERLDPPVGLPGQPDPLERGPSGPPRRRERQPGEPGEVGDLLEHPHAGIEPAFLGHVADPAAGAGIDRRAVPAQRRRRRARRARAPTRISVVLPAPLGPSRPTTRPGSTVRVQASSATHVADSAC